RLPIRRVCVPLERVGEELFGQAPAYASLLSAEQHLEFGEGLECPAVWQCAAGIDGRTIPPFEVLAILPVAPCPNDVEVLMCEAVGVDPAVTGRACGDLLVLLQTVPHGEIMALEIWFDLAGIGRR